MHTDVYAEPSLLAGFLVIIGLGTLGAFFGGVMLGSLFYGDILSAIILGASFVLFEIIFFTVFCIAIWLFKSAVKEVTI